MSEERNPKYTSPKASNDWIGASRWRELEVREILDSILTYYNNMEEQTKELPKELQDSIFRNWIAGGEQLRIARSQETQRALQNK